MSELLLTQTADTDALEYVPPVATHLIESSYVAQTYKIQVALPSMKRGERTRFPVVYVTDGNRIFDLFKGIAHIIQATGRDAPRFILVGIGYPSDSPRAGAVLRTRDFMFAGSPKFDPKPPPVEGVLLPRKGTKALFGGEDFQRFIAHELIPLIDASYPTTPDARSYFGHSGGGSFGLSSLFSNPQLFDNYIISSPCVQFHGESSGGVMYENFDFLLREARRFIASGISLAGINLYLSVGSEEEFEPGTQRYQLTSSFYRMAALLKDAHLPGLRLVTEAFAGETHMTVWPMAFMHGLQAVFRTGRWARDRAQ